MRKNSGAFSGLIFDLDGVICFTDRYHYQGWKRLADEEGVYFDETINHRLRGVSRMASLEIVLERAEKAYSQAEKEEMAERKNRYYRELLGEMTPADLPTDRKETLIRLKESGLKLAIGSSSKNAKFILERIGLDGFFDEISDGTMISRSKPDPEVFLKAAKLLQLEPAQCLVIEDAKAVVEAPAAGGFQSAALGPDAQSSSIATYKLESFSDLLQICGIV